MKFYDELRVELEAIEQQMVEVKKNEREKKLKEVRNFCKEFSFTAGILQDSIAEDRRKN